MNTGIAVIAQREQVIMILNLIVRLQKAIIQLVSIYNVSVKMELLSMVQT